MSSSIALLCLLAIVFVLSEAKSQSRYGRKANHYDDDDYLGYSDDDDHRGYNDDDDYGRHGHKYSHGYYQDASSYRQYVKESRYNDYEDSEYYLKKVYGEKDDDDHQEAESDADDNSYERKSTYSKVVVDNTLTTTPVSNANPIVDPNSIDAIIANILAGSNLPATTDNKIVTTTVSVTDPIVAPQIDPQVASQDAVVTTPSVDTNAVTVQEVSTDASVPQQPTVQTTTASLDVSPITTTTTATTTTTPDSTITTAPQDSTTPIITTSPEVATNVQDTTPQTTVDTTSNAVTVQEVEGDNSQSDGGNTEVDKSQVDAGNSDNVNVIAPTSIGIVTLPDNGDSEKVVVVVLVPTGGSGEIPSADSIIKALESSLGDDHAVIAQEVEPTPAPVLSNPSSLAIAIPTVTIPSDHIAIQDGQNLIPSNVPTTPVSLGTQLVLPETASNPTVSTTIAVAKDDPIVRPRDRDNRKPRRAV